MNELDRLLALATREPAYGAPFYRALLESDVYALILEGERPTPDGKIRFVMWKGEDGAQVVPIFSNRAAVRRALKRGWEAMRLRGRTLFEGCRGTTVVLNPNEALYCRLTSPEIVSLLETGSPDPLVPGQVAQGDTVGLEEATDAPESLRRSLAVLLEQFPEVERAYLLTRHRHAMPAAWLVAVLMDTGDQEPIARRVAALAAETQASRSIEFVRLISDSGIAATIQRQMAALYTRCPPRDGASPGIRMH